MDALILTLHVIICITLVVIVMLQSGQEGMGVIFGGGSSSLFGSSGAGGLLTKVTAVVATLFILTSLTYTYMTREEHTESMSVMDSAVEQQLDKQNAADEAAPAPAADVKEEPAGIQVDDGGQDAAGTTGITTEQPAAPATGDAQQDEASNQ